MKRDLQQLIEARFPQGEGRRVCSAFVRASCKCCFPGEATLLAAQVKGTFVIRLRPQGCSRNPNVRRHEREIALGKQDSTVATGCRVHL